MWLTLLWLTLGTTALFEIVTCIFRFGFKMRSREIAPRFKKYTLGMRIHHGYVGAVMIPPTLLLVPEGSFLALGLLAFGAGLILSDLLHHFVVLPIFTGRMD